MISNAIIQSDRLKKFAGFGPKWNWLICIGFPCSQLNRFAIAGCLLLPDVLMLRDTEVFLFHSALFFIHTCI